MPGGRELIIECPPMGREWRPDYMIRNIALKGEWILGNQVSSFTNHYWKPHLHHKEAYKSVGHLNKRRLNQLAVGFHS